MTRIGTSAGPRVVDRDAFFELFRNDLEIGMWRHFPEQRAVVTPRDALIEREHPPDPWDHAYRAGTLRSMAGAP